MLRVLAVAAALWLAVAGGVGATDCLTSARKVTDHTNGVVGIINAGAQWASLKEEATYTGKCHSTARLMWAVYGADANAKEFTDIWSGSQIRSESALKVEKQFYTRSICEFLSCSKAREMSLRDALVGALAIGSKSSSSSGKVVLVKLKNPAGHHFVIAAKSDTQWMLLQSYVEHYLGCDWLNDLKRVLPQKTEFDVAHALWGNGVWFDPNAQQTIAGVTGKESFLELIDHVDASRNGNSKTKLDSTEQAREVALWGATDTINSRDALGPSYAVSTWSDTDCDKRATDLLNRAAAVTPMRCSTCLNLVSAAVKQNSELWHMYCSAEFDRYGIASALKLKNFEYSTASTFASDLQKQYATHHDVCLAAGMCPSKISDTPVNLVQLSAHTRMRATVKGRAVASDEVEDEAVEDGGAEAADREESEADDSEFDSVDSELDDADDDSGADDLEVDEEADE